MPVDGSKTHLGQNLGLDFGSYLQGRSFQRSVSISDTVPDKSSCANPSDSPIATNAAYPGPPGRFASGGPQPSPSPLSSATATISPDSPLPSVSSSPFPIDSNTHPLSQVACAKVGSEPTSPSNSSTTPERSANPRPSSLFTSSLDPGLSDLPSLLQNPVTHKTLALVSHLIDSRLPVFWRKALVVSKLTSQKKPPRISPPSTTSGVVSLTSNDTTDSSVVSVRRPIPPTPSPSEDISVVKRFKRGDEDQPVQPVEESRRSTTSIPLDLALCVVRLCNHFESRYRDKLGNLLEDVARLSNSSTEDSTSSEGAPTAEQFFHAVRGRFHLVLKELFADRVNWGRVVAMLAFVRALCEHVEGVSVPGETSAAEVTSNSEADQNEDASSETTASAPPSVVEPENPRRRESSESELEAHTTRLRAAHYVTWTTEFVHGPQGIFTWISDNGGWEGLVQFESERGLGDVIAQGENGILGALWEEDTLRLLRRAVTGVTTLAVGAVGLMAAFHYLSKRF